MNYETYFEAMFESIPDYRKITILMLLIENDKNFLLEVDFSERDINRVNLEFRNILIEEHENYIDYVKNEEESLFEKILNK